MKTIKVKLTGIRPLIMHNAAMIDPDNRHVRAMDELKQELKKKKKDDFAGKEKLRLSRALRGLARLGMTRQTHCPLETEGRSLLTD